MNYFAVLKNKVVTIISCYNQSAACGQFLTAVSFTVRDRNSLSTLEGHCFEKEVQILNSQMTHQDKTSNKSFVEMYSTVLLLKKYYYYLQHKNLQVFAKV